MAISANDIKLMLSQGGSSGLQFTPTYLLDAENATLGSTYVGSNSDQWLDAANLTIAQNTNVLYGTKAWRMRNNAFSSGFGNWGGIKDFTARGKGQSIHAQVSVYYPSSSYAFTQFDPWMKFLRFATPSGYQDLYVNNDRLVRHIFEPADIWTSTDQYMQYDTWETWEYRVDFDDVPMSSGGTGRVRVWRKIAGVMTLVLDIQNQQTLTNSAHTSSAFYIYTYWNGEPSLPTTIQDSYADRIIIEPNVSNLVETDTNGYKIIGGL